MNILSKRAVILVGGKGTRLRPYTLVLPKPLMPIGEYPILEVVVRQLAATGFNHITMAVNHQAEIIKAFFQSGDRWKIKIDYVIENNALGTMGPLTLINDLPDDFLVMNGDILTDINFGLFHDAHCKSKANFTISSKVREHKIDYGVLDVSSQGFLIGFREKPVDVFQVSMGIYMLKKETVNLIPVNQFYGFDSLMLDLLAQNTPVRIIPYDGYWLDIGRPDDYEKAIEIFESNKTHFITDAN